MKIHLKTLCVFYMSYEHVFVFFLLFSFSTFFVFPQSSNPLSFCGFLFSFLVADVKNSLSLSRLFLSFDANTAKNTNNAERRKSSTSRSTRRKRRLFYSANRLRSSNTRGRSVVVGPPRRISWFSCTKGKCWRTRRRWRSARLPRMGSWW